MEAISGRLHGCHGTGVMRELHIRAPDDFHVHVRVGALLELVLPATARSFARALVMPNLEPPVVTAADARAYRDRIRAALPRNAVFTPLMTLYLTDTTDFRDVERAIHDNVIQAVKLYPAGSTTNARHGITDYRGLHDVLAVLADAGVPLCIHGEDPDPRTDIFDRELAFITGPLERIRTAHPELKIVLEHITTSEAVGYVRTHRATMAATITVHHLVLNRNDILAGGIRPHNYCLPVAKREEHRRALLAAATSGDGCFFLGTDSAPHDRSLKESACGCAGIFTSPVAMPLLAGIFDNGGALDRLEAFVATHGADFYGLDRNPGTIRLRETEPYEPGSVVRNAVHEVVVFDPGQPLTWQLET